MTKNPNDNPAEDKKLAPDAEQTAPHADKTAADVSTVVQFTNAETAKKYVSLVPVDRQVHNARLYSGPLSNITPAMAAAMVEGNSNLVKEK